MTFKNTRQRLAVCWLLMRVAGRGDLWAPPGPTEHARTLRDDATSLPADERVMLLVSLALFDEDETLRFADLRHLSPEQLFAVGSLLAAMGVDCMQPPDVSVRPYVDRWIADERELVGE